MNNKNINWVWSHRRKMSLHHLDIFVSGLVNNGFSPALNYVQKNQLAITLPGNDTYLFDDVKELSVLDNNILKQAQNESFTNNLYIKNSELFGSLLLMSGDMRRSNLNLYSNDKILSLYNNFIALITQAPLIRIQLTGIDACWSKNSPLKRALLAKAENEVQYKEWARVISHFSGESVAKTEQMDFLLLVKQFYNNISVKKLLVNNKNKEAYKLIQTKYKKLENALLNHISKYEWISSEYTGQGWDAIRWLAEISKFLKVDPSVKIKEIKTDENNKTKAKQKLLKELKLNKEALRIIDALDCFSAIRDWSKGYFVRALLDYRFLLSEISERLKINFNDLLYFNITEVRNILETGKYNKSELKNRKNNGVAILLNNGHKKFYTKLGEINKIKNIDVVNDVFVKKDALKEFSGRTGYPGIIRGKVKIVLNSKDIKTVDKGDILVTYMTTMEFTPVFKKISALITDEGGISSHAAIISREFRIPCIVGSKVATRVLKNGDMVEVNAENGVVKILG